MRVLFVERITHTRETQSVLRKFELNTMKWHEKDVVSKKVDSQTYIEFNKGVNL